MDLANAGMVAPAFGCRGIECAIRIADITDGTTTALEKGDKWFMDEVFIHIQGKLHFLWRAVN
jgi:transposase-like protein